VHALEGCSSHFVILLSRHFSRVLKGGLTYSPRSGYQLVVNEKLSMFNLSLFCFGFQKKRELLSKW